MKAAIFTCCLVSFLSAGCAVRDAAMYRDDTRKVLDKKEPVLRQCYDAELQKDRTVGGKVGPVPPVGALPILAVLLVVLPHEAVVVLPDGLHEAGPRIPNADIAGFPGTGRELLVQVNAITRRLARRIEACPVDQFEKELFLGRRRCHLILSSHPNCKISR